MKIGIPSMGENIESEIDTRFGRAAKFIIYDTDDDSYVFIDNTQNLESMQGAGIQTAQNIINAGAKILITPNCGPKAFKVLSSAGIKVFKCGSEIVSNIINKYKNGALEELNEANVEGHWA